MAEPCGPAVRPGHHGVSEYLGSTGMGNGVHSSITNICGFLENQGSFILLASCIRMLDA